MKNLFHVNLLVYIAVTFCVFQAYAGEEPIIDKAVVQKVLIDEQKYLDVIKPILDKYKRPITVLDLGAGQGYFTFRIAHDYDATCIMVEKNNKAKQLLELCRLNPQLKNIALLDKNMSLQELGKLADCEHFDVVLAFDYIDQKDPAWKQTIATILRLGDNTLIQASGATDIEYLAQSSGKLILQTPDTQEKIFLFERKKEGLRCKNFTLTPKDSHMDIFHIKSSYTQKLFFKNGSSSGVEWKKGINLVTFLMLNGTYPTKADIKEVIGGLMHERLSDFAPWNLIVQGKEIKLIDQNSKDWRVDKYKSLKFINKVIDQTSNKGILDLFAEYRSWRVRRHK